MRTRRGAGLSAGVAARPVASMPPPAAPPTRNTRSDQIENRTDGDPRSSAHTGDGGEERATWARGRSWIGQYAVRHPNLWLRSGLDSVL